MKHLSTAKHFLVYIVEKFLATAMCFYDSIVGKHLVTPKHFSAYIVEKHVMVAWCFFVYIVEKQLATTKHFFSLYCQEIFNGCLAFLSFYC
jgi:hypothetical protein